MTPGEAEAAIRIRGLRVVRGANLVIPGLDLDVRRGVVTGLLGPSGCGKSTLMRAIVGVQQVARGEVEVLGEPAGEPPLRSRVGYVTQAPSVYADLSARENLEFFRRILGASPESVDRALEAVDLGEHADRPASALSGGQFARVSLAVALLNDPELLVLDEPTVGLDPVLRRELWGLFHRLAAAGTTLLVSSHVMDEAMRCDRLLLMREGQVIADDEPQALLERMGVPDVESAFLALIEDGKGAA
ncbi:MAG: ABC transporter ATP-binding protein [Dehalococcoidia bacterium]|nr:ABC transporter ATP-binding protein [Dehalococcoidia bacterium]